MMKFHSDGVNDFALGYECTNNKLTKKHIRSKISVTFWLFLSEGSTILECVFNKDKKW